MEMSEKLEGRTAIITGAGQGMGRSVANALGCRGASLVLCDVNEKTLAAAVDELKETGVETAASVCDVTDSAAVRKMVSMARDSFGVVGILINNAGVLKPTKVVDISEEEWDFVINVNMKSTFLCSQAVLPLMRDGGWGRIVNFSSTAGKNISTVGGAHYTAAKAGILGFTRHLAKEVAEYGITVNSVCPGLIDTEMVRKTINGEKIKEYAASFPVPRLGTPDEVAELVAFLVSDRAAYITGASLDINGGDLMI